MATLTRSRLLSLLSAVALTAGCPGPDPRIEGSSAGDCDDGADNDGDGLFDCADPGCAGSPRCALDAGLDGGVMDAGAFDAGADAGLDAGEATDAGDLTDATDGSPSDARAPRPDAGPTSAHVLSRSFGASSNDTIADVAVLPSGNIAIVGRFFGPSIDFGGGPLLSPVGAAMFFAILSPAGAHVYSARFQYAEPRALAVDSSGRIAIVGLHRGGPLDLGGAVLPMPASSNVFVLVTSPSGAHVWSRSVDGVGLQYATDVAFSSTNAVVVTGTFDGSLDFGGAPLVTAGGQDIFLASYSATGTLSWSRRFGATVSETAGRITALAGGAVAMSGQAFAALDLGGGVLSPTGSTMGFVASFDGVGAHVASRALDVTDGGLTFDVTATSLGGSATELLVAGTTPGGLSVFALGLDPATLATRWQRFDVGTTGPVVIAEVGGAPIFASGYDTDTDLGDGPIPGDGAIVVGLTRSGALDFWRTIPRTSGLPGVTFSGIAATATGQLVLVGQFDVPMDLGGGVLTPVGLEDVFLVVYDPL